MVVKEIPLNLSHSMPETDSVSYGVRSSDKRESAKLSATENSTSPKTGSDAEFELVDPGYGGKTGHTIDDSMSDIESVSYEVQNISSMAEGESTSSSEIESDPQGNTNPNTRSDTELKPGYGGKTRYTSEDSMSDTESVAHEVQNNSSVVEGESANLPATEETPDSGFNKKISTDSYDSYMLSEPVDTGYDSNTSKILNNYLSSEETNTEDFSDQTTEDSIVEEALSHDEQKSVNIVHKVSTDVNTLDNKLEFLADKIGQITQDVQNSQQAVKKCDYDCKFLTEQLMANLEKLDSVSGSHIRSKRRAEVKRIQALLSTLDDISIQIIEIKDKMARNKIEQEEEQEQQQGEQSQQNIVQREHEDATTNHNDLQRSALPWDQLTIHPTFRVTKLKNEYVVYSHLPGLRPGDMNVSYDQENNTIRIHGICQPTKGQEDALRNHVISRWGATISNSSHIDELVLEAGRGYYGKFEEIYTIDPEEIIPENIVTNVWKSGGVEISIPRRYVQRQQHRYSWPDYPQVSSYSGYHPNNFAFPSFGSSFIF